MFQKFKKKMLIWCAKSVVLDKIYSFFRFIFIRVMAIVPDEAYAKWFYKLYTKKKLNLNNPTLTNEKMWWLKINNRDPLMTLCSDKHLVRGYVADAGFSDILIPQVASYENANQIDFSQFTVPVILKSNNGSGQHVFYTPGDMNFNEKNARKRLNFSLKQKYHLISREWNYKNIPPRIVAEEIIKDGTGAPLKDFRFFCFDGKPKLLMMDVGVFNDEGQYQATYPRNIYDMDFNLMDIHWGRDRYEGYVEKPKNFERMKEIAEKLSQPFPMCRVDLYNIDGQIYFGEITFYHGGCCQKIEPLEWDLKIASWIDLDSPKIVRK